MGKRTLLTTVAAAVILAGSAIYFDFPAFDKSAAIAKEQHGSDSKGNKGAGGQGGQGKGGAGGVKGKIFSEDDDSDRPDWAGTPGKEGKPGKGNAQPGGKKGDLFGDMYVILRDENGVPILSAEGFVQPIDKDGNPIPLDEEGHPIDETLVVEVEIGRLNVGRAPSHVLESRLKEAIDTLNAADSITLDAAGRLVVTIDGVEKTIDSPLENLGLYIALMETGTLGLTVDSSVLGDLAYLNDGQLTAADFLTAASLLGAATDKAVPMSIDQIVYTNVFLDIDGTITQGSAKYVDFSDFSYDREDVYGDMTATILVEENGVWVEKTVNVFEAVFGETDYESDSGVDGFTQAADDARAVINFIHEYEIPQ